MSVEAQASGSLPGPRDVDREALLAALVLAPSTFARNKFFALFTEPWAQQTRARATQLRTIVRHLSEAEGITSLVGLQPEGERMVLRYAVPSLHLVRTARLELLEVALLRFALSRRAGAGGARAAVAQELGMTDDDRRAVEAALGKLSRELHLGGP